MTFRFCSANAVRVGWLAAIVVVTVCYGASAIPTTTFDLAMPTVTSTEAQFSVAITWDDDMVPGATVTDIFMSVFDSDPLLTTGGTDFGRFSFVLGPALVGWEVQADFADPPSPLPNPDSILISNLPLVGPPAPSLGNGMHDLGTLVVDLSGMAPGSSLFVTLASPASVTPTGVIFEDPQNQQMPFNLINAAFNPDQVLFTQDQVTFRTPGTPPPPGGVIPEPLTTAMGMLGIASLVWPLRRRRGA